MAEFENQNQKYIKRISELEAKNSELERKARIMDEIPEGCELQHNILLERKTNIKYCWNCWNKINGRERRVLEGDEYSVHCRVCGIFTTLKDPPNPPPYSVFE
jgi:hypothetical protein